LHARHITLRQNAAIDANVPGGRSDRAGELGRSGQTNGLWMLMDVYGLWHFSMQ